MKKYLAFAMALAMVAASFAGCGSSSSAPADTTAATTAAAGEAAEAPAGTGTVKGKCTALFQRQHLIFIFQKNDTLCGSFPCHLAMRYFP